MIKNRDKVDSVKMMTSEFHEIQSFFDEVLNEFTSDEKLPILLEAKEFYFNRAGQIDEDADDFESRMIEFNEWYIFHFIPDSYTKTLLKQYFSQRKVESEIFESFSNVNNSIFEYLGKSLTGSEVFYDFISGKKIKLSKAAPLPTLVKGDVFMARQIIYKGQNYFLNGITIIPKDVRSILKKESKKIRKIGSESEKDKFLLKVQGLKSKWLRYGHVDISKIFHFS